MNLCLVLQGLYLLVYLVLLRYDAGQVFAGSHLLLRVLGVLAVPALEVFGQFLQPLQHAQYQFRAFQHGLVAFQHVQLAVLLLQVFLQFGYDGVLC